ncbi:MAG: hypothetical protein CL843_05850 [Crocinitomicaceae bacterium]|nr:hypothetical protein [Crocinitomicaceae bacterium]|tara:strand:- start:201 stop:950 length:750 start_codon:yes stop_codon:yes gene_type:complete
MNTLKLEDNNPQVVVLQHLLNLHGADLNPDGDFGNKTKKAVIAFQEKHVDEDGVPLSPDGIVGNKTWWALVFGEAKQPIPEPTPLTDQDSYTVQRMATIHPDLRDELKAIYQAILNQGVAIRFTSVFRSFEEQNQLYAQGRNGNAGNIVTYARGGSSYHNYGLAVDFCLLVDGGKQASWSLKADFDKDGQADWMEVVQIFNDYGWEWGGSWSRIKDYPHFQKTFNKTTAQLKELVESGNTLEGKYPQLS